MRKSYLGALICCLGVFLFITQSFAESKYIPEGGHLYPGIMCQAHEPGTVSYSKGAIYNKTKKVILVSCPIIRERDGIKKGFIRFIDAIPNRSKSPTQDVICDIYSYAKYEVNDESSPHNKYGHQCVDSFGGQFLPPDTSQPYAAVEGPGMITKKVPEVSLHDPINTFNDKEFGDVFDAPGGDWHRYSAYSMECSIPPVWTNTKDKKFLSGIAAYWFKE